jgi:group I intron endonuclease
MIIYKITNKVNDKIYIGQTIRSLSKRWKDHLYGATNCSKLYKAIKKYGPENFTIEEIDGANSQSELNYKEWFLIYKFNSLDRDKGYNLREGGGSRGRLSQETKDKISKAQIGKKHTEKTKQKMSISHKGRVHSKEARKKLSKAHTGKKMSEEARAKMSTIAKNRIFSEETRARIGEKSKNRGNKPVKRCDGVCYKSIKDAALDLDVDKSCISAVARGHRKKVKGYVFEYL